jgi:hypothetical protein
LILTRAEYAPLVKSTGSSGIPCAEALNTTGVTDGKSQYSNTSVLAAANPTPASAPRVNVTRPAASLNTSAAFTQLFGAAVTLNATPVGAAMSIRAAIPTTPVPGNNNAALLAHNPVVPAVVAVGPGFPLLYNDAVTRNRTLSVKPAHVGAVLPEPQVTENGNVASTTAPPQTNAGAAFSNARLTCDIVNPLYNTGIAINVNADPGPPCHTIPPALVATLAPPGNVHTP